MRISTEMSFPDNCGDVAAMTPRTSQFNPGNEIPEINVWYRVAKKFLFNDFGVYRGQDHSRNSAPALLAAEVERQSEPTASAK